MRGPSGVRLVGRALVVGPAVQSECVVVCDCFCGGRAAARARNRAPSGGVFGAFRAAWCLQGLLRGLRGGLVAWFRACTV